MSGPVRLKIVRGIGLHQTTRVYKLERSGGRGPAGPAGSGLQIDYSDPIPADATGTITPNDGDFFLSAASEVTIIGTAGEVFEPAKSAETSRVILGPPGGASIALTINTSSLGVGGGFAIEAKNGESRVMRLNSIGDLVKTEGVVIPDTFDAFDSVDQPGKAHSTFNKVDLDSTRLNYGSVISSGQLTPRRVNNWEISCVASVAPSATAFIRRVLARLYFVNIPEYRHSLTDAPGIATVASNNRIPGGPRLAPLTPSDVVELHLLVQTSDSTPWTILGDLAYVEASMTGTEVVEW